MLCLLDYLPIPDEAIQAWQQLGAEHLEVYRWMTYAVSMPHQWVMLRALWAH